MRIFIGFFITLLLSPLLVWADPGSNGFQLISSAFEDNAVIPKKYTCDGQDVNPPLIFKNVPAQAKSLALTVSDPDAPNGRWSHWVRYDIPPDSGEIVENVNRDSGGFGIDGPNDFGSNSYGGPCPPSGKEHHYIFHAYALDDRIEFYNRQTINKLEKAIEGHILAQAQLVGTYQK